MTNWKQHKANDILTGSDSEGNRLLSLFAKDYKLIMQDDLCTSCNNFQQKLNNFLKKLEKMKIAKEQNSGFELKPMYDNIALGFGSQVYVSNQNMTDDLALELIKTHPLKKELFSKTPENVDELIAGLKKPDVTPAPTVQNEIVLFTTKFSVEKGKELILKAGIETKAKSVKGLEEAVEKATVEQKATLENLVIANIEVK